MTGFWSAIFNCAIISALLTVAVWVTLRLTPRHALNAATRYAIWWIVLLATTALPLSFMQWRHYTAGAVQSQLIPLADPEPALPVAAPAPAPHPILPLEIPASPWLRPMLLVWTGAALLLLLRVALSYATLYRRTARAADAPPELRARLGVNRPRIRIALSDEIDIPMAVGPFRPAILIPAKLFASMTESDLDQIGLHEATHLARRDDYTLFLQRIVEALFALHPVVRWITRQLDLEREIACDDAVARSADTARSYADCLTRMVHACGGVRAVLAAANVADSYSHLSRRVELLVCGRRNVSPRLLGRQFLLVAVALLGAVALLAKTPRFVTFSIPRTAGSAVVTLGTELPPTPPVQEPVVIAQVTQPTPPLPPPLPQPPTPPPPAPQLPLYVLGPNDVIGVAVFNDNTVSGSYAIGPDGRVSMPLIGNFSAAGLTIPELQSLLTQKLDAFINDPVVNVQLLRNNSPHYRLMGGVLKPGPYPLLRETTILDALAASGGLDALAAPDKIFLLRGRTKSFSPGPADGLTPRIHASTTFSQTLHFNYDEAINGIHPEQNVTLQDGDILFVPVQ